MNQNKEEWRAVVEFEGLYEVSNKGNVRSVKRYVRGKNNSLVCRQSQMLRSHTGKHGYPRIILSHNCKQYNRCVHRLVAQAFIPNPNQLPQINHLNEDKTDNRVENLEWSTASHNINWGTRNERVAAKMERPVIGIRVSDGKEFRFKSIVEAQRQGHNPGNLLYNCKRALFNGYLWKYADDKNWQQPEIFDKRKAIVAISVSDEAVTEFESLHEADRLGHSRTRVKLCLEGKQAIYHNCYWKYKNDTNWHKPEILANSACKAIYGISVKDGSKRIFNSIKEAAAAVNGHACNISACLSGIQQTCKGYRWYFSNQ